MSNALNKFQGILIFVKILISENKNFNVNDIISKFGPKENYDEQMVLHRSGNYSRIERII